jgi:hypothetical protein
MDKKRVDIVANFIKLYKIKKDLIEGREQCPFIAHGPYFAHYN